MSPRSGRRPASSPYSLASLVVVGVGLCLSAMSGSCGASLTPPVRPPAPRASPELAAGTPTSPSAHGAVQPQPTPGTGCPPSPSYTRTSHGGELPSHYWCGNANRIDANGQPVLYDKQGNRNHSVALDPTFSPPIGVPVPRPTVCQNNGDSWGQTPVTDAQNATPGVAAIENAEVRGWIVYAGSGNNGEDEWEFSVLLDVGWDNTAGVAHPMNTIAALAGALSPVNFTQFGVCDNVLFQDTPNRKWCGTADFSLNDGNPPQAQSNAQINLNPEGTLSSGWWGGRGAPILHVELNGWGSTRAPPGPVGWNYAQHPPSGWTYFKDSTWWPASDDLSVIHAGDYVRLVGILWKDDAHQKSAWENSFARQWRDIDYARDCLLQSYTDHAGWTEMHPVDFIEVIAAPAPCRQHTIAGYFACDDQATPTLHDAFVARGQSFANGSLAFDEVVQGAYTNWKSMKAPNNGDASTRMSVSGATASFALGLQGDGGGRALFSALYDVHWTCAPKCAGSCSAQDDGCNGTCPPVACAGGRVCGSAGTCVCPPEAPACPPKGGACVAPGACCPQGQALCPCGRCGTDCNATCAPPGCTGGQAPCDCADGACMTPAACKKRCASCPLGQAPCACADGTCMPPAACSKVCKP